MVCFLCGRPGHGVVNRCSRVDTLFPFLPPGWSVAVQDGQYRAVWPGGSMARFQSGNEGWSGLEGQPPGPSVTVELLTPAGGGGACCPSHKTRNRPVWVSPVGHAHGSGLSPSAQAFPPLVRHPPVFSPGVHSYKRVNRRTHVLDRVVQDSPIWMGGNLPSLFTPGRELTVFPAVAGMEFPAVAEDLSLADDAGGLPSAVCVSEPLLAAAGADPLIDVEAESSVVCGGLQGPPVLMPREAVLRMGASLTL